MCAQTSIVSSHMFLRLLYWSHWQDRCPKLETHPSLESRIPWRTDLKALAAVALRHIINPNKWKLGSPYKNPQDLVLRKYVWFSCSNSVPNKNNFRHSMHKHYSLQFVQQFQKGNTENILTWSKFNIDIINYIKPG